MRKSVEIKGRRLEYELTRKKVKNINMRIRPDGSVAVSAPPGEPLQHIEDFVASKAALILSAIAALEEQTKTLSLLGPAPCWKSRGRSDGPGPRRESVFVCWDKR